MEEVMNALRKIQNELDEQKTTILKSCDKVTEQVTQNINKILEEKFKTWEEKYDTLKYQLENQEKRLYFLEKQARQRNIVIFGFEETETSYSNLEKNLLDFVDQHFSTKIDRRDIQEVRRIGKRGENPRPLAVTFSTLGIKIDIFKQRRTLKDTSYYIKEDYPQHILEKRKKLQEQVRNEKEKGNKVIIKYDKLIILNKPKDTTGNKKRTLSLSPENNVHIRSEPKVHTSKKNKTLTQTQRTSSLSDGVMKPGMLGFLTTKNPNNESNKQENKNMSK